MARVGRHVGLVRIDWLAFLGVASGSIFALLGATGAALWMFIVMAVLTIAAGVFLAIVGKERAEPATQEISSEAEPASPRVVAKGKRSIASWINTGTQNTGDGPEL